MKDTIKKLLREGLLENQTNTADLTNRDKEVIRYILGDNELNEANGREMLSRLATALKKGAISAAALTALMSTPAFSQVVDTQAPDNLKAKVSQVISQKADDTSDAASYVDAQEEDGSVFKKNLSKNYDSGSYKLKGDYITVIKELKNFLDKNEKSSHKIKITASESKVPNQAPFQEEGSLARERGEELKRVIHKLIGDIDVELEVKVGDVEWDGSDKDAPKYRKDQYVILNVFAEAGSLCDIDVDEEGEKSPAEAGFVSHTQTVNGTGTLIAKPGSIPDRFQIVSKDGKMLMDTGYFVDEKHNYPNYRYVPLYIAELSESLANYSNLPAMQGLEKQIKSFNSFEELAIALLENKEHNYARDTRNELKNGLYRLKQLWDGGQREFLFYDIGANSLRVDTKGQEADLVVYSPVTKTGFSIDGACDIKK